MVRKIEEKLLDDIDGSPAEHSLRFLYEGAEYEIDLNDKNKDKFDKAMQLWVMSGRKLTKTGKVLKAVKTGPSATAVREWAKSQGIEVNEKGRVPEAVVAQFSAAGN